MTSPLLAAHHLSKHFGHGHTEVRAVQDVSLTVQAAEIVLIMGPSGSGKTTLLSLLGGLLRPSAGTIAIAGTELTTLPESALPAIRALKLGFIFQAFNLLEALTVEENILFPARLRSGGVAAARTRAQTLMASLNLSHRRHALPHTLSGGEKQRVAIARALINEPPLILADEPTGNLDSQSGQDVMMILHDVVREQGCSVIVVTHDPRVEDIADRLLWLEDGALRDRKAEAHDWVRDPICGMRVDAWTATAHCDYEGQRYSFCSQRCLEKFQQAPAGYLSPNAST